MTLTVSIHKLENIGMDSMKVEFIRVVMVLNSYTEITK